MANVIKSIEILALKLSWWQKKGFVCQAKRHVLRDETRVGLKVGINRACRIETTRISHPAIAAHRQ
jgi:hypothetical protein